VPGHLASSRLTADLPGGLNDLLGAAGAHGVQLPRAKLAAIGVDGEIALVGGVVAVQEVPDLSLGAQPGIFEAHGLENGVSVVEIGELDVLRRIPRHLKGAPRRVPHRRLQHVRLQKK